MYTHEDYRPIVVITFIVMVLILWFCNYGYCEQALYGPGGSDYIHGNYIKERNGTGAKSYYIFIPDDPELTSAAPTIVFLHGLYGTMPSVYIGWIAHIVRKGNIVIFPVYQSMTDMISSRLFLANIVVALHDALNKYGDIIDINRMAVVGHSAGGLLSANLAATTSDEGLPYFKAVMCVAPGKTPIFKFEDLSQIPKDTYLLSVAGNSDLLVGTKDAKTIFAKTDQIVNRNYILVRTDLPALAFHFAPLSGEERADNIDYYCYWKLFEALCDAAFYNNFNREYCLDNTPEQRYMGEKSDGQPFKELLVEVP